MAQLPMVGGRISRELKALLDAHCQETQMTVSEVIQEALVQYFNATPIERVKSHDKRIADLERKLNKVMRQLIAQ